eukprot:s2683_g8.t1
MLRLVGVVDTQHQALFQKADQFKAQLKKDLNINVEYAGKPNGPASYSWQLPVDPGERARLKAAVKAKFAVEEVLGHAVVMGGKTLKVHLSDVTLAAWDDLLFFEVRVPVHVHNAGEALQEQRKRDEVTRASKMRRAEMLSDVESMLAGTRELAELHGEDIYAWGGQKLLTLYRSYDKGAHKADMWRYIKLFVQGGHYMDIKEDLGRPPQHGWNRCSRYGDIYLMREEKEKKGMRTDTAGNTFPTDGHMLYAGDILFAATRAWNWNHGFKESDIHVQAVNTAAEAAQHAVNTAAEAAQHVDQRTAQSSVDQGTAQSSVDEEKAQSSMDEGTAQSSMEQGTAQADAEARLTAESNQVRERPAVAWSEQLLSQLRQSEGEIGQFISKIVQVLQARDAGHGPALNAAFKELARVPPILRFFAIFWVFDVLSQECAVAPDTIFLVYENFIAGQVSFFAKSSHPAICSGPVEDGDVKLQDAIVLTGTAFGGNATHIVFLA